MTGDHPRAHDCLIAASADYGARTGTHVVREKRSLQAFADVPIHTLARDHDLILPDHPHVGQIAESGCLLPLSATPGAASLGGSVECHHLQGQTWAWPIDAACRMSETPRFWPC
jgi:multiple sugar transport system substrate-binding protein